MTLLRCGFVICCVFLWLRETRAEGLLITCAAADSCDFRVVASLSINGREFARPVIAKSVDALTIAALRTSRERRIDTLPGILRDPASGSVSLVTPGDAIQGLVFPGGSVPKDAAAIPNIWAGARITTRDSLKAKNEQTVPPQTFTGYLLGRDLKDIAVTFARDLVSERYSSPWRSGLLKGALRFADSAPAYKAWRDQLFASSTAGLEQYRRKEGDPRRLADSLRNAIHDGEVLSLIAPSEPNYAMLLTAARQEYEILNRKTAIATALSAAEFWDEYVLKLRELGVAEWSFPQLGTSERSALMSSAKTHIGNAEKLVQAGYLDRAFDEAQRAYRQNPCSADVASFFSSIRAQRVEQSTDPRLSDSTDGRSRPDLQQLERQLQSLEAIQLQQETYRKRGYELIARGEAIDRSDPAFQLAKAQFFLKTGRLSDAFDVVIGVERHSGLYARQRDEWLSLDAKLSNDLAAVRDKSQSDAESNIGGGRFREALDATTRALEADPKNPQLLLLKASAAASLRETKDALQTIQTLLQSSNAACAEPSTFEKAFALRNSLVSASGGLPTQSQEPGEGVPHWISGRRYAPGKLYYDPVSLGFVPRLELAAVTKGATTTTSTFTWDGLRLVSITTQIKPMQTVNGTGETIFFVEPEYAPGTLRMTAISPRAIQEGKRLSYPLAFWNDPNINIGLLQANGHPAARGWAGNPVFDPFVWSGLYLFDFKYDEKGRVIEAYPVPDETRGRSFSENLTFEWDDSSNRLKSITGKTYRRVFEYDTRGRLIAEEETFRKSKGRTFYHYVGNSPTPRQAKSNSVFDHLERTAVFEAGN